MSTQPRMTPAEIRAQGRRSPLVDRLLRDMADAGLPKPVEEHHFHPTRQWRFDLAYPDLMLAIEVEGGRWSKGRHTRGHGFADDVEKYNAATGLGWTVLRFTDRDIKGGYRRLKRKGCFLTPCCACTHHLGMRRCAVGEKPFWTHEVKEKLPPSAVDTIRQAIKAAKEE